MNERGKDILFVIYVLSVFALSIIYFSVPERIVFLENAIQWWKDLWLELSAIIHGA
jgi:hypothetical protein